MRRDHRPFWLKRMQQRLEYHYTEHFLRPQCEALGAHHTVMKPWYLHLAGPGIRLGRCFTAIAEPMHRIELAVWGRRAGQGQLVIGDYALLSPGVRISVSDSVQLGHSCMLAHGVYITDSDWHGLYDRIERDERIAPVRLGDNVWVGDHAQILKGVTVGDNAVIGAGAVVSRDVAANTVVVGNPAREVKRLDPDGVRRTRADCFADPREAERYFQLVDRELLCGNSLLGWLRSRLWPRGGD
jgi:acetyltransferase-like isoleucine patch superfamily enzyme